MTNVVIGFCGFNDFMERDGHWIGVSGEVVGRTCLAKKVTIDDRLLSQADADVFLTSNDLPYSIHPRYGQEA